MYEQDRTPSMTEQDDLIMLPSETESAKMRQAFLAQGKTGQIKWAIIERTERRLLAEGKAVRKKD